MPRLSIPTKYKCRNCYSVLTFRYCVEFEVLKASKACRKLPPYNKLIEGLYTCNRIRFKLVKLIADTLSSIRKSCNYSMRFGGPAERYRNNRDHRQLIYTRGRTTEISLPGRRFTGKKHALELSGSVLLPR